MAEEIILFPHKHILENQLHSYKHLNEKIVDQLIMDVKKISAENILNIECGNSTLCHRLAEFFYESHVIATDSNISLIEKLNLKYSHKKNLALLVMDPTRNSFNNQFDLIVWFSLSNWVYNQSIVLEGIYHSLKVQGHGLLILPLMNRLDLLIQLVSLNPKWRSVFRYLSNVRMFYTEEEYLDLIKKSGLKINYFSTEILSCKLNKKNLVEIFLTKLPELKTLSMRKKSAFYQHIISSLIINACPKNGMNLLLPILKIQVQKI